MGEQQYLHLQAEHAKIAIRQTLGDLGAESSRWVKKHPWKVAGVAAVAGVVAAAVIVPQFLRRHGAPEPVIPEKTAPPEPAPGLKSNIKKATDLFKSVLDATVLVIGLLKRFDLMPPIHDGHDGHPDPQQQPSPSGPAN